MITTFAYYWVLFWYLLVAGPIASAYLYKNKLKSSGVTLGVSSFLAGTVGVVEGYYSVDDSVFLAIIIAWLISATATVFLSIGPLGGFLLLGPTAYLMAGFFFRAIPFSGLYPSITLTVAGIAAYDFSRVEIAPSIASGRRPFRAFLTPFSQLERLVKRLSSPRPPRYLLFVFYFSLLLFVLVLTPVLLYIGTRENLSVELTFSVLSLGYVIVARLQIAKTSTGFNDSDFDSSSKLSAGA